MNIEEIRDAIEACAVRSSAHLIDLAMRGTHGRTVIEVFIDAETGVTSDLCSEVSRNIAEVIDQARWIQGSYRLDVSSPGIGRPLCFPWQYKKHIGRTLKVRLRSAKGIVERLGRLASVEEHGIVLEKGDAVEEISFDTLVDALVKPPW